MNGSLVFCRLASVAGALILCASCSAQAPVETVVVPEGNHLATLRDSGEICFDDHWRFFLGDNAAASSANFDDHVWRTVDLPHDWGVEGAFDPKLAACTGFLSAGIGWYRKSFVLPRAAQGQSVRIRFDGVSNHSTVWCNGVLMGQRPYGYSSFNDDLTPVLHFDGRPNAIAVRVDHEHVADSRWYNGSGIYRHVWLTITSPVHVDTDGTFVTTPKVNADAAQVDFVTTVRNDTASDADVNVSTFISDPAGNLVATLSARGTVSAKRSAPIAASGTVANPALWSPDHPAMYTATTQVKAGDRVADRYTTSIGIRTFAFDAAKGFSLNGQTMKLKGVCLHHDAGALGAAVPIEVWQRRLALLKESGCNAIRCSHNPPAPEFLDLCDHMGFLVMDEAFDEWTRGKKKWIVGINVGKPSFDGYHSDFDQWADTDIRDMVVRDRNHPSIILWSIGNEIDFRNDAYPPNSPELPPIAARLIKDVKAVDLTRPVTAACASPSTNLFKRLLDVEGYNYMERLYDGDHAIHPERILYGSENSQTIGAWQAVADNDFIAGQFLWTGIDYLGESGGWPSHASPSGLLDLAGFKKDQFYFRQSLWTDTPMLHLSTTPLPGRRSRNGAQAPIAPTIYCYTNCDRVELFQDGRSLGERTRTPAHFITWPLKFTSGTLHAVGHKGDAEVADDLKRAGAATALVLQPDVHFLPAGERHVAQIELSVVDADGTIVPDAAPLITCSVAGPGRLRGIENGNIQSTESYRATSHSAYHGHLMIYVESIGTPGDMALTVTSPHLQGASASVPVK